MLKNDKWFLEAEEVNFTMQREKIGWPVLAVREGANENHPPKNLVSRYPKIAFLPYRTGKWMQWNVYSTELRGGKLKILGNTKYSLDILKSKTRFT